MELSLLGFLKTGGKLVPNCVKSVDRISFLRISKLRVSLKFVSFLRMSILLQL